MTAARSASTPMSTSNDTRRALAPTEATAAPPPPPPDSLMRRPSARSPTSEAARPTRARTQSGAVAIVLAPVPQDQLQQREVTVCHSQARQAVDRRRPVPSQQGDQRGRSAQAGRQEQAAQRTGVAPDRLFGDARSTPVYDAPIG